MALCSNWPGLLVEDKWFGFFGFRGTWRKASSAVRSNSAGCFTAFAFSDQGQSSWFTFTAAPLAALAFKTSIYFRLQRDVLCVGIGGAFCQMDFTRPTLAHSSLVFWMTLHLVAALLCSLYCGHCWWDQSHIYSKQSMGKQQSFYKYGIRYMKCCKEQVAFSQQCLPAPWLSCFCLL